MIVTAGGSTLYSPPCADETRNNKTNGVFEFHRILSFFEKIRLINKPH
jgi:hypothetical protein